MNDVYSYSSTFIISLNYLTRNLWKNLINGRDVEHPCIIAPSSAIDTLAILAIKWDVYLTFSRRFPTTLSLLSIH